MTPICGDCVTRYGRNNSKIYPPIMGLAKSVSSACRGPPNSIQGASNDRWVMSREPGVSVGLTGALFPVATSTVTMTPSHPCRAGSGRPAVFWSRIWSQDPRSEPSADLPAHRSIDTPDHGAPRGAAASLAASRSCQACQDVMFGSRPFAPGLAPSPTAAACASSPRPGNARSRGGPGAALNAAASAVAGRVGRFGSGVKVVVVVGPSVGGVRCGPGRVRGVAPR